MPKTEKDYDELFEKYTNTLIESVKQNVTGLRREFESATKDLKKSLSDLKDEIDGMRKSCSTFKINYTKDMTEVRDKTKLPTILIAFATSLLTAVGAGIILYLKFGGG